MGRLIRTVLFLQRTNGAVRRGADWLRDRLLTVAGILLAAGQVLVGALWREWLAYATVIPIVVAAVAFDQLRRREALDRQLAAAMGQMAGPDPWVRIAGACAIASVADRHPGRRQRCINVLAGYLRLPYDPETVPASAEWSETDVRQTIIRIFRDHLQDPRSSTTWCGADLDFTGVVFDGVDFTGAVFDGGWVSFDDAVFGDGAVLFVGARFAAGVVSFTDAVFGDGRVSFADATFGGASVMFDRAAFCGTAVNFAGALFAAGTVGFNDAAFIAGGVRMVGARFDGCIVTRDGEPFRGWTAKGGFAAPVDSPHVLRA